jgi:purine operon repressor
VLVVDDFMKAGGTAKGLIDLMQEFEAEVVGFAVLIVTAEPKEKLIQDYVALLELKEIAQDGSQIVIQPSRWVKE